MSQTECDVLVIGGGAAGCIVARRLAETTSLRIILVEAGRSDEGDPLATDLSRLEEQDESYDWGFRANTTALTDLQIEYARARMLGGCANHNDCAFLAPTSGDLARWEAAGGDLWSRAELLDCLSDIEKRIYIEPSPAGTRESRAFIDAGLDLGLPERRFRSDFGAGAGWFPLNARGALRQSSSICYLHPLADLPANLEVRTDTQVTGLTFDGRRATGAETTGGRIAAAREVILCAGSICTPQLLMISGIGPGEHLKSFGIDVRVDNPGIGQNLADHVAANIAYETHDAPDPWELTPCEATALVQTDPAAPEPDVLFHFVLRLREKYVGGGQFTDVSHGVKISPNVARPRSRGTLRLAGPGFDAKPVIDLNYFSDPEGYDRKTLIAGLRFARRMGEAPSLAKFLSREVAPGPEVETDDELFAYIRDTCETVYHPAGTCKLGAPDDPQAVVAPDLRVRGIDGLRVADASVFPDMATVNICNTVMMVAERATRLVLGDFAKGN